MNELLAIVLIVLLCCAMFFAWLFALATCPDRLVNLISGTKSRSALSSSPMSRASEDLGARKGSDGSGSAGSPAGPQLLHALVKRASPCASNQRDLRPLLGRSRSIPSNRSNGGLLGAGAPAAAPAAAAPLSAEKRANSKKLSVVPEADEQLTITSLTQCGVQRAGARTPTSPKAEDGLVVRTVLLSRHHSDCAVKRLDEKDEDEAEESQEPPKEMSAEERSQLYNDGPAGGGGSCEEVRVAVDEDDLAPDDQLPSTRRSAPPRIHIV